MHSFDCQQLVLKERDKGKFKCQMCDSELIVGKVFFKVSFYNWVCSERCLNLFCLALGKKNYSGYSFPFDKAVYSTRD